MYYQLTMQFGPSDVGKIKKILDIANEEDIKELEVQKKELGIRNESETFPWEEEAKPNDSVEPNDAVEPNDSVEPNDAVEPNDSVEPKEETKHLSREDMVTACRSFQKAKGKETLRTLLGQFKAKKLDEVNPGEWPQLYEALNA